MGLWYLWIFVDFGFVKDDGFFLAAYVWFVVCEGEDSKIAVIIDKQL